MVDEVTQEVTGAQETPTETQEIPEVTTETGATETPGGNESADRTATTGEQPTPQAFARITRALEARQKEVESLKARLAETPDEAPAKPAVQPKEGATHPLADHPALKGMQFDPSDGTVNINGQWLPAEVVTKPYDAVMANVDGLRQRMDADSKAREQAELTAKQQAHEAELAEATDEMAEEMLGRLLPVAEGQVSQDALALVQGLYRPAIAQAYGDGTFTPELAERTIKEAIERVRRISGAHWGKQIADNQQYAETHKAQPGAPAGTKAPIPFEKLSRAEQEKVSRKWAQDAENQSRRS